MRFGSSLKRSKDVDLELFITKISSNFRKQSLVEPNVRVMMILLRIVTRVARKTLIQAT